MSLKGRIERLERSAPSANAAAYKAYADAGGWRGLVTRKGLDVTAIDAQVRVTGCSPAEAVAAQLGMTSAEFRRALEDRARGVQ